MVIKVRHPSSSRFPELHNRGIIISVRRLQLFNIINICLHVTTSGNNEGKLATKFRVSGNEIRPWHAKFIFLAQSLGCGWPEELTLDQCLAANVHTLGVRKWKSDADLRPGGSGLHRCLPVIGGLEESSTSCLISLDTESKRGNYSAIWPVFSFSPRLEM